MLGDAAACIIVTAVDAVRVWSRVRYLAWVFEERAGPAPGRR
jgi:hypothetical protein